MPKKQFCIGIIFVIWSIPGISWDDLLPETVTRKDFLNFDFAEAKEHAGTAVPCRSYNMNVFPINLQDWPAEQTPNSEYLIAIYLVVRG